MSAFWSAIASGALRGKEPERRGRRVTFRDDSLPHQIRIGTVPGSHHISVSCNCKREPARQMPGGAPRYEPLESRACWQPHEPMEVWRKHMAEVNAA